MNRLFRLVFLISMFFLSCMNDEKVKKEQNILESDIAELHIISPHDCSYIIILKGDGVGNISLIKSSEGTGDVNDSTNKVDSVIQTFDFALSVVDNNEAKKILNSIKSSPVQKTNRKNDAYQFVVQIDKMKYIDVYGEDITVNKLLTVINKYFETLEDRCGFFKLFNPVSNE